MNTARIRTVAARLLHWASTVGLIAFAAYAARTAWTMFTGDPADGYILTTLTFAALGLTVEMMANRLDPDEGDEPCLPVQPGRPARLLAWMNGMCVVSGAFLVVNCVMALIRDDALGYALVAVGGLAALAGNVTTGIARDLWTVKPEAIAAS